MLSISRIGHLLFLSVLASLWLWGGMLYIWMISLIFYRYMFFRFSRSDLLPPYWINMGAVAISAVAGAALAAAAPSSPLLRAMLPVVNGLTLLFWATATWWIPNLVLLGIWRPPRSQRGPLRFFSALLAAFPSSSCASIARPTRCHCRSASWPSPDSGQTPRRPSSSSSTRNARISPSLASFVSVYCAGSRFTQASTISAPDGIFRRTTS